MADVVVDTSDLNVNQLRERLAELFSSGETIAMQILVLSFGFKHGVPLDVDNVLDVRFLPNPHWVEAMRPLTGLDEPVRRYVLAQPEAKEFLERVEHLLKFLVPAYVNEGKSYLTIAIGCTGGRHRSVVLAEEIADGLRRLGLQPERHPPRRRALKRLLAYPAWRPPGHLAPARAWPANPALGRSGPTPGPSRGPGPPNTWSTKSLAHNGLDPT